METESVKMMFDVIGKYLDVDKIGQPFSPIDLSKIALALTNEPKPGELSRTFSEDGTSMTFNQGVYGWRVVDNSNPYDQSKRVVRGRPGFIKPGAINLIPPLDCFEVTFPIDNPYPVSLIFNGGVDALRLTPGILQHFSHKKTWTNSVYLMQEDGSYALSQVEVSLDPKLDSQNPREVERYLKLRSRLIINTNEDPNAYTCQTANAYGISNAVPIGGGRTFLLSSGSLHVDFSDGRLSVSGRDIFKNFRPLPVIDIPSYPHRSFYYQGLNDYVGSIRQIFNTI